MQILARLVLILFIFGAGSLLVVGQIDNSGDSSKVIQETRGGRPGARTTADETFELNIDQRSFTRENFEASTTVGTEGEAGLNLQVGVALAAGRIDVLLRNVRGMVHFHGTLERVIQVIQNRRTAPK